jgi:ketosteroid isomerase-like protein
MSEQENIGIVEQIYSDFKIGNIPGLLSRLADDITWQLPEIAGVPFAGKRAGRNAVGEFFAVVGANQEPLHFEPREFIAQANKVVSLGYYKWRVKETGREFESDFAHVFTIGGGKVTAFREFTDTAAAAGAYQKAMRA